MEVPLSNTQKQLAQILKQANRKELISFLLQYADKHPDFYQAFLSDLQSKAKTTTQVDYAIEIQKCFKHSSGKYGFRSEGRVIAYKLNNYFEKAISLIKSNCQEEAMTILLHLMREIGKNYEKCDDYNGVLGGLCQTTAELVTEMIETGLPASLQQKLTDEIEQLIKNSNYDNYDLADLNELLCAITLKTSNFDNGIRIHRRNIKNEPDTLRTSSLVLTKIELLENADKKAEIEKVISSYLYLPEIRKIRLKKWISEKQYEKALTLIDEGISQAEKKGYPGSASHWKDKKLSAYRLMGNKEKAIELAENLFVNGRESIKYYPILKAIIPTEKWG